MEADKYEVVQTYRKNGRWTSYDRIQNKEHDHDLDLMLDVPYYITFKDGDILHTYMGWTFIYKNKDNRKKLGVDSDPFLDYYAALSSDDVDGKGYPIKRPKLIIDECDIHEHFSPHMTSCRFATESEKTKLYQALVEDVFADKGNKHGKSEDYIKMFFKDFDGNQNREYKDDGRNYSTSGSIFIRNLVSEPTNSPCLSNENEEMETSIKSDGKNNSPDVFDKVIVRDFYYERWKIDFYSHKHICDNGETLYACAGGYFKQCIPFKNNKHLVGTTEEPLTENTYNY